MSLMKKRMKCLFILSKLSFFIFFAAQDGKTKSLPTNAKATGTGFFFWIARNLLYTFKYLLIYYVKKNWICHMEKIMKKENCFFFCIKKHRFVHFQNGFIDSNTQLHIQRFFFMYKLTLMTLSKYIMKIWLKKDEKIEHRHKRKRIHEI